MSANFSSKNNVQSDAPSKQSKVNNYKINALQISLASPEYLRSLSKGEVLNPETINYKSFKPEKQGLFCEAIFGPTKDYECYCGKYKKIKYRGKRCEKCGVCITESLVRRDWMGHIELACPVAHIWMIKELPLPSKISLVLGIRYKHVMEVVYFVNYIVLDPGHKLLLEDGKPIFEKFEIINVSDQKSTINSISKLRKMIRLIFEDIAKTVSDPSSSIDYQQGRAYYKALFNSNLPFSIVDVFEYIEKHTGMKVGIGAEAIYDLLKEINLDTLCYKLNQELTKGSSINYQDQKVKKLLARLQVVNWLKDSGNSPEWMILKVILIIPPNLRPIIQLDGGRFTASDINTFYRRIIIRNDRLKRILNLNVASVIANNEKRMLQEAVDSLIDNSSRKKPLSAKDAHPLKSLTDHLKGKQGLFRQNLLGKRVDYSGRSVIVVGPELKLHQVGLPVLMILKLFRPFIIRELIRTVDDFGNECIQIAPSIKAAEKIILDQSDELWPIVHKVIRERPVILNRAPTLHRLGIQAFEPVLVEGKAICLHPLVTTAFNADFDGDQMAIHLPLSAEAVHEARSTFLSPWNILSPKNGKPIVVPSQDMILGIYYLTTENNSAKGQGTLFESINELKHAYALGNVDTHAKIAIPTSSFPKKTFPKNGLLITTPGKVFLNEVFPEDYGYVNGDWPNLLDANDIIEYGNDYLQYINSAEEKVNFAKNSIYNIIEDLYNIYDVKTMAKILDAIKNIGFEFSTRSCITISPFDVPRFVGKEKLIDEISQKVKQQKDFFNMGLLTDDERYKNVISLWNSVKEKISVEIKKMLYSDVYKNNPITIMSKSGARGNLSNFIQLSGMRGLMNRSYNYDQNSDSKIIKDIIEVPIKHSFIEGLSVIEYFNSSYGARKGMTDTAMKTAKSGYMTRKLVDAAQEVIVKSLDCGAIQGFLVKEIRQPNNDIPVRTLYERILYRYPMMDVVDPNTSEIIVAKNEIITHEIAEKITNAGITEVLIRSVLCCQQHQGICQKCFGYQLTTKKPIEVGTAIGVIAAQSVGEPATQLTMRTFHSGGVADENNISQGFERLKQLFDIVAPNKWEEAIISEISGTVTEINLLENKKVVIIKNDYCKREYEIDINLPLMVKVNDEIKFGQRLCVGLINLRKLLEVSGIKAVRQYIIEEIQQVYWLQGIDLADKYIEIIVYQLTSKLKILSPNDSQWNINEVVDVIEFTKEVTKLLLDNKTPPTACNIIFGLEEAPSKTNSFLAAASFQDTKKILTDAAVQGRIDHLASLKENIIVGNLIPAGTGLLSPEEIINNPNSTIDFNY